MIKKITYFLFISSLIYTSELITNIQISGNTKTKEEIILNVLKHPTGIPFNTSIATNDQKRIYDLDIFNFVQVGYIDSTYHILVQEKRNFSLKPEIKKNNTLDRGVGLKIKFNNVKGNNNQIESGFTFGDIKYFYLQYTNSLIKKNNQTLSILSQHEQNNNLIEQYKGIYSNIELNYNFKKGQSTIGVFLNNQKNQLTYLINNIQDYNFTSSGIILIVDKKNNYKKYNLNLRLSKYFSLNNVNNYSKIQFKHQHIKKIKNTVNSPHLLIKSQIQLISNNFSPIYEMAYLGGDDLVRSYETNPELNNIKAQNKLKFKNFIFNTIQFEIPVFNTKRTQTNLFFFIDQAIGSNKNNHFNFSNKIKGYGVGYSIATKKEIKFDLSIGLNNYGQRIFHFNVIPNPY